MGTAGSFEAGLSPQELDPLREVLRRFFASGATVIDTAPTYSSAEDVLGASLRRMRADQVDLLQVHNVRDTATQLAVARELIEQGKVKYVGLMHYLESAQPELAEAFR